MARLGISNIAWGKEEDNIVYDIIRNLDFYIDIAPTRIWENPFIKTHEELTTFKNELEKKGIKIIAMQSLLFGHPELTIFENRSSREKTLELLMKCVDIGNTLGATALVFGSPKNRKIPQTMINDFNNIAEDFFSKIGEYSKSKGVRFCLEPNPAEYGTNFLCRTEDAFNFVKKIDTNGLKVNIDTGTMIINKENPAEIIPENLQFIGHVHVSEPFLEPIDSNEKIHLKIAKILRENEYVENVSIEMKSGTDGANITRARDTMVFVKSIYRGLTKSADP